jgi:hypothetical protein
MRPDPDTDVANEKLRSYNTTRQPTDFDVNAFEKPRLYQVSPDTHSHCCTDGGNFDMR